MLGRLSSVRASCLLTGVHSPIVHEQKGGVDVSQMMRLKLGRGHRSRANEDDDIYTFDVEQAPHQA